MSKSQIISSKNALFFLVLSVFVLSTLFIKADNSAAQITITLDAQELYDGTGPGPDPTPDNNDLLYTDVDTMGIVDINVVKISGTCMNLCTTMGCPGNCGNSSDMWGKPSPGAPFSQQEGIWLGCMFCPAPGSVSNAVRSETYQIDFYETGTNNRLLVDKVLLRFNSIENSTQGLEELGTFQVFDENGLNVTGSTNIDHTSIFQNPANPNCGGGTIFDPFPNNDIDGVSSSGCNDGAFLELSVTNGTLSSIRFTRSDFNNIFSVSPPCCINESDGSYLGLIEIMVDTPPTPTPTATPPGMTPEPTPPGGGGSSGPRSVPALDVIGLVGLGGALLIAAIFMLHRRRRTDIK